MHFPFQNRRLAENQPNIAKFNIVRNFWRIGEMIFSEFFPFFDSGSTALIRKRARWLARFNDADLRS